MIRCAMCAIMEHCRLLMNLADAIDGSYFSLGILFTLLHRHRRCRHHTQPQQQQ